MTHTDRPDTELIRNYNQALEELGGSAGRSSYDLGEKRRRGGTARWLSAFLAGAVAFGGLSFAADRMNLYTAEAPQPTTVAASVANVAASSLVTTASVALNNGEDGANTIADIVEYASPAVVKIETKATARRTGQLQTLGTGSGFIFESSGYILTNEHVIDGAAETEVTLDGYDEPFAATVVGSSYDLDLAVLKIEGDAVFPTLPIGSTADMEIGEWVVAIGNPYDFDHTVTAGVLSARGRSISIAGSQGTVNYTDLIQTDAAINPGNSGGPLLNLAGEVIGINTAIDAEAEGIGFAISTETIQSVLEQLIAGETIPATPTPYLGVQVYDLTSDMLEPLGLDSASGAIVAYVLPNTAADRAGLRPYDVIARANGDSVADAASLTALVQSAKVGDALELTVIRDGEELAIDVTIGDQASAGSAMSVY
jgi:S1-C subfamily serine protease